MNFIVKNKGAVHAIMALSYILDILVAIIINLLTQEKFSIFSLHNLVSCGILVLLVVAHIICSIIQHNASLQTRNKKLLKAFQEHGGYDAAAEEAIDCLKRGDFRTMKNLRKVLDVIER